MNHKTIFHIQEILEFAESDVILSIHKGIVISDIYLSTITKKTSLEWKQFLQEWT